MAFKNKICCGGKVTKERLTVLLCSNMIVKFKSRPIISKAKRQRTLKKLEINSPSIDVGIKRH